jgi:tetratricopeptide (TPR) repeat protein
VSQPESASRLSRLVRRILGVPRYLIRHPGRSLVIVLLLLLIGVGASMAGFYLWASYHLREARAALERYHNNEAMLHLHACLTVRPHDPDALLLAARAARRSNNLDGADEFLNQYQTVRGADDEALFLERVLVRVQRGEIDSVSNYCRSLIEQDHPAAPLVLEAIARGCMRMYRPVEAEHALKEWLQRQPDNPEALSLQGQLYDLQMRMHDAIVSFRRALTVDPELDEARIRLFNELMQLGLAEEAQPHLEYLCQRFPDNPMLQVHLARSRDRQGQMEEAEKILDAVLARHPNLAAALAERGKLAQRARQTEEAERYLRKAVQLEPGDHQANYQLWLCLDQNGKAEEARKVWDHMDQITEDMRVIQDIAATKMQRTPHDPALHYKVGMISLRAGSTEEGLRWLQSALKEDPAYAPAHLALANYYQRRGDLNRAAQHRQKAGVKTDSAPPAPGPKQP